MKENRPTILIVYDDKINRDLLSEILKDDHKIVLASNGFQALERTLKHRPDIILLDIVMPEMSGYAVLIALKVNFETQCIPVIFLTVLTWRE